MNPFTQYPTEIIDEIWMQLSYIDILNYSRTCTQARTILKDSELWMKKLDQDINFLSSNNNTILIPSNYVIRYRPSKFEYCTYKKWLWIYDVCNYTYNESDGHILKSLNDNDNDIWNFIIDLKCPVNLYALCHLATKYHNIDILQRIQSMNIITFDDDQIFTIAIQQCSIPVLNWLYEQGIAMPYSAEWICESCFKENNLNVLCWLTQHGLKPYHKWSKYAVANGNSRILNWTAQQGTKFTQWDMIWAAIHGTINAMIWLENQGITLNETAADYAAKHKHLEVLQWLEIKDILPTSRGANYAKESLHTDIVEWCALRGIFPDT